MKFKESEREEALVLFRKGCKMLKIDGNTYNIPIKNIKRKAEFLDKHATRTQAGDLRRELIGVYYNYELSLGAILDIKEYQRLWDKLTEPKEFHTVTVPAGSGEYTFTAYFSNVSDEIRKMHGNKTYFKGLTVNFIAKAPARK